MASHRARSRTVSPHRTSGAIPDAFLTRLKQMAGLGDADLDILHGLYEDERSVRARVELIAQGTRTQRLHVLIDGWACRYRLLADGRRQITELLLPGDICDLDALYVRNSDFAVMTLMPCTVVTLDRTALRTASQRSAGIADALGWLGAVENAMLAERNACLGRRSAREHLAHLFCELLVRLTVVGRTRGGGFHMPLTQEEMADVLGLTSVHINRVLQGLKTDGLVEQRGHDFVLPDWNALRQEAGFRADYLHLEGIDGIGGDFGATPWAFAGPSRPIVFGL
ncbi:Crp/Fnr family transcriptional regulator [Sphingomonas gellani]|uniref:Crp/Fnr family transcriptional regulator n=1 Tax=Sphingomonas gellani TaxID=1166340 RepID=UPI00147ADED2|nr:Crp/Fnr family transcriptional regulator [Sphingomonas gellani]